MSGRNRFPFTASQWQELEHQALIYKYMATGIPIPPDLLFTIKRSYLDLDSTSLSSRLLSHQPQHIGWNYIPMGLGRKVDPEPGRCRRTDGKKWRCSKEAYPDSKYCERHMHRGKNRSRKPVEVLKSSSGTTPTNTNLITASSINKNNITSSLLMPQITDHSSSDQTQHHRTQQHPCYNTTSSHLIHHPFLYHHHHQTSSRPSGIGLSFQDNTCAPLFVDSSSYSQTNPDYRSRYGGYGLKEEVDEHAFFSSEPSGTMRNFSTSSMEDSWQLTPLTMSSSSSSSSKQRSLQNDHLYPSYLQLQSLNDASKEQVDQQDQRFLLGSEIKCEMPLKLMAKEETHKTVHRFFDEWPPPKSRDSWLDLDEKSSNTSSASTTRLSISIPNNPNSSHDFPPFNPRTHHDG